MIFLLYIKNDHIIACVSIYFVIRIGVNLYRNLRFPYIYLNNHRDVITTSRYDSSSEINRHINYISDYVVYVDTSTRFILTFEYDHYLSSETLEIFIKDLTKRFSPSLEVDSWYALEKPIKIKLHPGRIL